MFERPAVFRTHFLYETSNLVSFFFILFRHSSKACFKITIDSEIMLKDFLQFDPLRQSITLKQRYFRLSFLYVIVMNSEVFFGRKANIIQNISSL